MRNFFKFRRHRTVILLVIAISLWSWFLVWLTSRSSEKFKEPDKRAKTLLDKYQLNSKNPTLESYETNVIDRQGSPCNYTAVIVELRNDPAFELVISNFVENLDKNWQFVIFHGKSNEDFVKAIAEKHSILRKFTLVKLCVSALNIHQYNRLMLTKDFYSLIPTETFLVFQTGALINKNGRNLLENFLTYDYVGAPWEGPNRLPWLMVGKGGLSLRRKTKMLEIFEKCSARSWAATEDEFFSFGCDMATANKPSIKLATQFAVSSLYSPTFFAVFRPWERLNPDDYAEIVKQVPLVNKLRSLVQQRNAFNNEISKTLMTTEDIYQLYETNTNFQHIETKVVNKNPGKVYKYTALIVEPRKHPALEFVVGNFVENLDENWEFVIFHGKDTLNFVQKIVEKYSTRRKFTLIQLTANNFNFHEYSRLFLTKDFYSFIPSEIFLVFQTDALINPNGRHLLEQFLTYDYVAGPWKANDRLSHWPTIGIGGLSLRRKTKMLEIIEKCAARSSQFVEDEFFSYGCDLARAEKPSIEMAKQFAVSAMYSPTFFGVHKPWSGPTTEEYAEIVGLFPDVEKLRSLNKGFQKEA